jgi:tight adherence protein B
VTAVAIVLAALAAALWWAPAGRLTALLERPKVEGSSGRRALTVAAAAAATVLAGLEVRRLALGCIVAGILLVAWVLLRRGRDARAAQGRQARVVEVCEGLVGELRAGQPLARSLERCVELWPAFEPVAAAGRLGADVPAALRSLARLQGAEGLRDVASAWQVSERSGAGLAAALGQVAASARARQSTRRLVRAELASAQATARLVALLPLMALGMGHGIGGDPVAFLLDTPVGLGCLAVGAGLAGAGLLWIDRIATGVLQR